MPFGGSILLAGWDSHWELIACHLPDLFARQFHRRENDGTFPRKKLGHCGEIHRQVPRGIGDLFQSGFEDRRFIVQMELWRDRFNQTHPPARQLLSLQSRTPTTCRLLRHRFPPCQVPLLPRSLTATFAIRSTP